MTTYRPPSEAQVNEALRRITTPQLRRAFFGGLKNPLWLEPLAKAGLFNNPPDPETTPDGLVRDTYWPEIDYLIRAAPDKAEQVVDVLLKLEASNNAWVRRAVFTIGASIPASEAVRLKPLLKSWLASGFGWRTDPREMVDFAINLLKNGEYKTGKWVANILFRPAAQPARRTSNRFLEDYWYEDGLPRVIEVLGEDRLSVVLPWLVEYERHQEHLTETFDMTYIARESIRAVEPEGLGSHRSVEHALIDAVRDLALRMIRTDASGTVSALLNSEMILGRKLALFTVGEALASDDLDDEQLPVLLANASQLLWDDESRDVSCRIEYAGLAQATGQRSPEALEPLTEFISRGPCIDSETLRDRLRRDDESEEQLNARVEEIVDKWTHQWLAAIGAEVLPVPLGLRLAELDDRFGAIDSPLAPSVTGITWVGPNSPITQDEMAVMSPVELVAHLETWRDTGDGWGPEPSHEGQARNLASLLTTNPLAVAGVDHLVARLRPTYLRAIFQGWEAALKAHIVPDWNQVVDVLRGALWHSNDLDSPAEGGDFDDDPNFRGAKKAAIGLLEELVKKREDSFVPSEYLAAFVDLLLDEGADETAWDEYDEYTHEGGMDPLTVSLNWQWPARLRGLVNLLSHGRGAPWYGKARTEFEREINRADRRGASRAITGESLGRLLNVDEDWLRLRVSELFGTAEGITRDQQIALTTAISVHRYHRKLYDLLAPGMLAALHLSEPIVVGWDHHNAPLQRVGEWVVTAIIFGHKTLDDPLAAAFFSRADPSIRGDALGHIAWSFMHAEQVDDHIRDRLGVLWDQRVTHVCQHLDDKQELKNFYWFVRSRKFSAEWWLPRLKEAGELLGGAFSTQGMIGKTLAGAAREHPHDTLEALLALLKSDGGDEFMSGYDLKERAAPHVIAHALEAGDPQLAEEATELMNGLGAAGYLNLEARVNDVRDGVAPEIDHD